MHYRYVVGPFTHASKNRGFSKIAILGWKLLSNFHPNNPKTSPEKSLSGVGFFETPRETSRSFASVNANRRKIAIFVTWLSVLPHSWRDPCERRALSNLCKHTIPTSNYLASRFSDAYYMYSAWCYPYPSSSIRTCTTTLQVLVINVVRYVKLNCLLYVTLLCCCTYCLWLDAMLQHICFCVGLNPPKITSSNTRARTCDTEVFPCPQAGKLGIWTCAVRIKKPHGVLAWAKIAILRASVNGETKNRDSKHRGFYQV